MWVRNGDAGSFAVALLTPQLTAFFTSALIPAYSATVSL